MLLLQDDSIETLMGPSMMVPSPINEKESQQILSGQRDIVNKSMMTGSEKSSV